MISLYSVVVPPHAKTVNAQRIFSPVGTNAFRREIVRGNHLLLSDCDFSLWKVVICNNKSPNYQLASSQIDNINTQSHTSTVPQFVPFYLLSLFHRDIPSEKDCSE